MYKRQGVHKAAIIGAQGKKVMIGFAHDEMHAFLAGNQEIENASDAQIEDVFKRDFGDRWQVMLNHCRNQQPGATPLEILSSGLNEANFAGQTCDFAAELTSKGIDTWLYRIDVAPPKSTYRACHCIELPFVFNTFDRWMPPMIAGLESHEAPRLAPGQKLPLAPGMIVTVEPGIYLPDRYGIRIEDTVVVTKTGYRLLSQRVT